MNKHARTPVSARAIPASRFRLPGTRRASRRYYAFLSYSHKDEALADWLHDELEQFRVPASLAGQLTENGAIPKRLRPIFRDRHELAAAGDLGEEIEDALANSQFLIVLCSPDAVQSRWTNAEIDRFKRARPDGCVLAAIARGEPFASEVPGREAEECFPPALRQKYDRRGRPTGKRAEPLAADLRDSGDGLRIGFLKLVAGMLGVGLDTLMQRETVRRQRRLALVAAASLAGMAITSTLAVAAIHARDFAREQRRQAEGLVAFMVGDLKDKLEPLGRLDVLDSVGTRALAYYKNQDTANLSDDGLAQRSKALTLLGQVASDRGNLDSALGFYQAAFDGTAEALRRSPGDPQRIFDHAQNVFYIGTVARSRGDLAKSEASARDYKRLATQLVAADPANPKWQMEGVYADTNLGVSLNDEDRYAEAAAVFANALADLERLMAAYPQNPQYRQTTVEVLAWLGEAREREGRLDDALSQREREIAMLKPLMSTPDASVEYSRQAMVAYLAAGRIQALQGKIDAGEHDLQTSIGLADKLLEGEPANTDWASRGGFARFELARIALGRGDTAEANSLTRTACDTTDRLVARDSTVVEWRLDLRGQCLDLRARIALSAGALDEADTTAAEMLAAARSELRRKPSDDAQLALVNAYLIKARVAQAQHQPLQAKAAFVDAAKAWPNVPDRPALLAKKLLVLQGTGRLAEAAQISLRLDQMGFRNSLERQDAKRG